MAVERTLARRSAWAERLRVTVRNPARTAAYAVPVLVLVAVLVRVWLSRKIATPWILSDELTYSELAESFASTGHFLIRGEPSGVANVVYPVVIAPAWWAHPMATTYELAKVVNVILMTSTVVPLYLWGRRLVGPLQALVPLVLVLLMPSLVYTGTLMTENAFLPAFVLAAYAFALALERPTLLRQLIAFGTIVLATFVRLQGLVLLLVLPTAILLKVLFEARAARRERPLRFVAAELRRYWISGTLLVGAAGVYALREAARGRSLSSGLGSYQDVANGGYSLPAVRHWVLLHFAELPVLVGVLPLCALLVLLGLALRRGGTRDEAERAFLAVTVAAVPWIVVEVAAFASRFSLRIEERYMFFFAPLLFLALVVWIDRGLPRPPVTTLIAAAAPAALLFALPLGSLLNISILSDTLGLIPFWRLSQLLSGGVPSARHFLLAGGFAAALLFVFWPRRALPMLVLPGAVAGFMVLSTYPVTGALRDFSRGLRDNAGTRGSPSWVDARLGSGGDATYLLGTTTESWPETLRLWETEFWNRSLRRVYNLGTPEPSFTETAVHVDPGTGSIVDAAGGKLRARYVVSDQGFRLAGRTLAVRPPLALYGTDGPLRLATTTGGVYGDGWMGADASYTRYTAGPAGKVVVELSRRSWGGPDVPGHVVIKLVPPHGRTVTRRWTIHSRATRTFVLPAPRGRFGVSVHVAPTFSPSQFGQSDTRQLGAQVSFAFRG